MIQFIRHLRLVNLFMIMLLMFLIRHTIIIPFLKTEGLQSSVSEFFFVWLVISALLIAAGGYFINDSEDQWIDHINKPKDERRLSAETLKLYGMIFLIAGVFAGTLISFYGKMPTVWQINCISALLLLNYSRFLKRIVLLAAIAVSILTSLLLIIVYTSDQNATISNDIRNLIAGYSLFAFLLSFIRENIKDLEDMEGDSVNMRRTLPLIAGTGITRLVIAFFIFITLILLSYIQVLQKQWQTPLAFYYVLFLIEIPLAVLMVKIFRDKQPVHYRFSSRICRLIMLAGVLTMPFFYFIL